MKRLDVASLTAGDLVLVECYVMRNKRLESRAHGSELNAWFEIQSVSRLANRIEKMGDDVTDAFPFAF